MIRQLCRACLKVSKVKDEHTFVKGEGLLLSGHAAVSGALISRVVISAGTPSVAGLILRHYHRKWSHRGRRYDAANMFDTPFFLDHEFAHALGYRAHWENNYQYKEKGTREGKGEGQFQTQKLIQKSHNCYANPERCFRCDGRGHRTNVFPTIDNQICQIPNKHIRLSNQVRRVKQGNMYGIRVAQ